MAKEVDTYVQNYFRVFYTGFSTYYKKFKLARTHYLTLNWEFQLNVLFGTDIF